MPYKTIQQNFANGELNPKMQGRSDVDMYYKSAQKMRNVATTPYGGFVRRPGSAFCDIMEKAQKNIPTLQIESSLAVYPSISELKYILEEGKGGVTISSSQKDVSSGDSILSIYSQAVEKSTQLYAWVKRYRKWDSSEVDGMIIYPLTNENPTVGDTVYGMSGASITEVSQNSIKVSHSGRIFTCTKGEVVLGEIPFYTSNEIPEATFAIYSDIAKTFYSYVQNFSSSIMKATNGEEFARMEEADRVIVGEATKEQVKFFCFRGEGYYWWKYRTTNVNGNFQTKERNPGYDSILLNEEGAKIETITKGENGLVQTITISSKYSSTGLATASFDRFYENSGVKFYARTENPAYNDIVYSYIDETEKDKKTVFGRVKEVTSDYIVVSDDSADGFTTRIYRDSAGDVETEEISLYYPEKKNPVIDKIVLTDVSSEHNSNFTLEVLFMDSTSYRQNFSTTPESKFFEFELPKKSEMAQINILSTDKQQIELHIKNLFVFDYNQEENRLYSQKIFSFIFNDEEAYLISVTDKKIKIYEKGKLVAEKETDVINYSKIPGLKYAQSADVAIFVHPDFAPLELRREKTGEWTLGKYELDSVPYYNFNKTNPNKYDFDITPDNLEGTVKMSFTGTIGGNVVGQYLEGNGGRLKITKQETNALIGYTVIGFYTKDTIKKNDWSITTNYEPVWSDARGWPSSVTFHQGRLWFGGSKERPQTVWGSKVGLFNKFDPTGGYDNDAIEFTLDTESLNKITDIYSAKGLYIFTLGGEFVCQTSYSEPITPKNVSALKQSSNGSWEKTQPVELEGSVIFVERKGQALMNFAYLTEDDYATSNASLVNSHLINQPEDLDVERNNLTQQTNYVYIVNKDGTMCVVNLLAAQGISGGFTLWETEGKVKSVCVLPKETYISVERETLLGKKFVLEKLDWDLLSDSSFQTDAKSEMAFSVEHLSNKEVDVLCDGKFIGKYMADSYGNVLVGKKITGKVEIGLPFRSYVQSNFLEVAQMGSGVGKLKRLATMVVRVLDTPEVTINGETQKGTGKGVEDIHFYGIGDWDEKPTWEFTQNTPYKFNVLAAQMDLNYQLSTESY